MAGKIPADMKRGTRRPDQQFDENELLYRRVPPSAWGSNDEIDVAAVPLPDISTMRQKFTLDPQWVLIDTVGGYDFREWGIVSVPVGGIPRIAHEAGASTCTFSAVHMPEDDNYPHTEIQAFDAAGAHLTDQATIPPELHLNFRERLLWKVRVVRRPTPVD